MLAVVTFNKITSHWVCQQNGENEIVVSRAKRKSSRRCFQMTVNLPETTSKMEGPLVKQFSVFLPNKVGAMLEVVKLLNTHNAHAVALSVSESTESAIARIIASDPARAEKLFREKNVPFGVRQVVVVEMREVATKLEKLIEVLVMARVNVHLAYTLLIRSRCISAIILQVCG